MKTRWYYKRDGKKYGPISSSQLREMAIVGKLRRTDLLWKEGMNEWRRAGDSSKLFERSGPPEQLETPKVAAAVTAASGSRASLREAARSAAAAGALAAERVKLQTVTLPAAYLAFGKHCHSTRAGEGALADEMVAVDRLEASAAAKEKTTAVAGSLADKTRALPIRGFAFASRKKAEVELNLALIRLGRSAFDKYGDSIGSASTISAITRARARLAEIEDVLEVAAGNVKSSGLTKRHLVWGAVSLSGLLLIVIGTAPFLWTKRVDLENAVKEPRLPAVSQLQIPSLDVPTLARDELAEDRSLPPSVKNTDRSATPREGSGLEKSLPLPHVEWVPPTVKLETLWMQTIPAKDSVGYRCRGAVRWSNDFAKAAVGLANGCVVLCDQTKGPEITTESAALWGHQEVIDGELHYPVADISFSPSDRYVAWITDSLNCTWGLAAVDTGKLVRHSPRYESRHPWYDGEFQPQWTGWGVPAIHMLNDTTLLFASGAGIIEHHINDGTSKVLNGCLPPTRQEELPYIDEQQFYADDLKPPGEWFDDNLWEALKKQGKVEKKGLEDGFQRLMTSFSPNGKYCAVMYAGNHGLTADRRRELGVERDHKVAVYEVGGKKVYEQKCFFDRPFSGLKDSSEVFCVFDDTKILEVRIGNAVMYEQGKSVKKLVQCDGVPLCAAIHPTLPCVLVAGKGHNVTVYAIDGGELDPFKRKLAEESVYVDGWGPNGAYAEITPDFRTLIVGVGKGIKAMRVKVSPGTATPD